MDSEHIFSKILNRRRFLKYGFSGSLAAVLLPSISIWSQGCSRLRGSKKPNVILISIDTLRADHLGCYGYNRPTSPFIDKTASKGVLFEDVMATSPWTLPSHGSLLTGFYPSRLGLNLHNSVLPSDVKTLAMLLYEQGFSTAGVVNSLYLSKEYGFDRGFEDFLYIPESHEPSGAAGLIINLTKDWLNSHKNEQFFLFLHLYDVHSDYLSLPEYRKLFARPYSGSANGTTKQLLAFRKNQFSLNKNDVAHLIDLYDAEIRQLDDGLRNLFAFIQQLEILENSFVIITADHGEEFHDHGGVLHGRTHYEELIHVPLLISGPGIPRAKRISRTVSLVDIMPTILGLTGIDITQEHEGYDLSSLWQQDKPETPFRYIFAEADHNNIKNDIKRAIRHPRFKLHYDRLTEKVQLFDLQNDPHEQIDISKKNSDVSIMLFNELKVFMQTGRKGKTVPLSDDDIEKLKSIGYL